MTELGVYILGATALVILAWAGVAAGSNSVVLCAIIASGAAYVSQFGAASAVVDPISKFWPVLAFAGLGAALLAWAYGVVLLF